MVAAPPPSPVPAPSATLAIGRTHGRQRVAVAGERIAIEGSVTSYAPGQRVLVTVYRNGRQTLARRVGIAAASGGRGRFRLAYASAHSGVVTASARHAATAQMGAFATREQSVRFLRADLAVGARGEAVRVLQRELAGLHYAVPVSGYFDEATVRAVIAYRKVAGRPRVGSADARTFALLQRGAGRFHVRFPRQGDHVEADLSKQVLVEVQRHGRVRRIYTMSSGKPSTPTVLGRFRVYEKTPGTNSEGMVDSNYFIRGYAIHGYAEVPVYAASHGCLRIPIPDAAAVYSWVKVGYPVDVYASHGGGSHRVRANAGP